MMSPVKQPRMPPNFIRVWVGWGSIVEYEISPCPVCAGTGWALP